MTSIKRHDRSSVDTLGTTPAESATMDFVKDRCSPNTSWANRQPSLMNLDNSIPSRFLMGAEAIANTEGCL